MPRPSALRPWTHRQPFASGGRREEREAREERDSDPTRGQQLFPAGHGEFRGLHRPPGQPHGSLCCSSSCSSSFMCGRTTSRIPSARAVTCTRLHTCPRRSERLGFCLWVETWLRCASDFFHGLSTGSQEPKHPSRRGLQGVRVTKVRQDCPLGSRMLQDACRARYGI